MTQDLINRYQPGGDIYQAIASKISQSAADQVAAAANTGDRTQVTAALNTVTFGAPLDTSTASILFNQLTTDPLGAPLASANTILGNTFFSFLKSPAVLLALGLVAFFLLGGADFLRRKLAKA